MKKYKILISDYDGTLAGNDNKISKENLEAINSFIARGGVFALCTGRATDSILPILRNAGLTGGYVASFNGAVLSEVKTGKQVYKNGLPAEIAKRFFTYAKQKGIYANFYIDTGYIFPFYGHYNSRYAEVTGVTGVFVEDIPSYIEKTNYVTPKILIYDEKEKLDIYQDEIVKLLPECEVVRSTNHMIDINLLGVNKGTGVLKIASEFGFDKEDVLAIGDAGNDLPMLKVVGFPVAMGNSTEDVIKICKAVAPDCDSAAIKDTIEKYCI